MKHITPNKAIEMYSSSYQPAFFGPCGPQNDPVGSTLQEEAAYIAAIAAGYTIIRPKDKFFTRHQCSHCCPPNVMSYPGRIVQSNIYCDVAPCGNQYWIRD